MILLGSLSQLFIPVQISITTYLFTLFMSIIQGCFRFIICYLSLLDIITLMKIVGMLILIIPDNSFLEWIIILLVLQTIIEIATLKNTLLDLVAITIILGITISVIHLLH